MAKKKPGKKIGRPTKAADASRGRFLQVRIQEAEKETFAAAAELSGLDVSAWVRITLRGAAKRELRNGGASVPFLEKRG